MCLPLDGFECVDRMLRVSLARTQYRRGEIVVVGGIGEVLRFERQSRMVVVTVTAFADLLAVHALPGIELESGLVGEYFHHDARDGFPVPKGR